MVWTVGIALTMVRGGRVVVVGGGGGGECTHSRLFLFLTFVFAGAMIAQAGIMAYMRGSGITALNETQCTQRFRTDEVLVTWRD